MSVDSHCHIDDAEFDADRETMFARAHAAGVRGFVLAGVDRDSWIRQREWVRTRVDCVRAAGLHPMVVGRLASDARALREQLDGLAAEFTGNGAAVALGETGLDTHFVDASTLDVQTQVFREQLALARSLDVPIVLHVLGRGTHSRVLETLSADGLPARGGMVHSFSGSAEVAGHYLRLGLCCSFAGAVARPTAAKVHAACRAVPEDRLLIETDAPDQAPPGTPPRMEPARLGEVAAAVAHVRGTTSAIVLDRCATNARRLFPTLPPSTAE
ncbi:MAG: TatD family hydrolase [Planctomycetes bacterium]|nr:TatD family hydrolase [Planctomycetota bacterium]MCC7169642.1 TatD family hydrolase [Planctomycetota bacterium]